MHHGKRRRTEKLVSIIGFSNCIIESKVRAM